ncbi:MULTISPECIES: universal stress protein [Rhodococcus]|uniref:Universal stress protein n=1 Tax=Rhodococcus rhodochrous TaxID=1829 RepID=A0AAW4XM51_RHORH|nr:MULTISPECIES: universal stress protein [Rhodococcus]MCD2113740.1 universal stress protein [Rhodococcus rhodochrous]QHG80565.1 universal stress protein [Rhodococcus rhodochrous]QOH55483.1 universal stress protein [Rhodococcus rhodochrous]WAL47480.1 universal stress protein [Rhodococcus pyridinivorans]
MTENKPIVVAVDGSDASTTAVNWAARTAGIRGLPLRIVTVVHIPAFYYSEPYLAQSFHEEMKATARDRLDNAAVLARQIIDENRHGNVEVTTEQLEGKVVPTLIAQAEHADRLVVGSRGLGEVKGLLAGSVSTAVVSHATAPVVVVRGRTLDGAPPAKGPVVVGVDGSVSCRDAVEVAFEEASARGATLVAVNVWSDVSVQPSLGAVPEDPHWSRIQTGEEIVLAERLAGYQERYPDVTVERVVARDRPVRVLSEYAEAAQLLVVGTRGRGGFKGLLLGSTSNALIQTADCPVLVVRSKETED